MNPMLLAALKLLMPSAVWLSASLIPGRSGRIALQECSNKVEIMELVQKVDLILSNSDGTFNLQRLVEGCYELGPFPALWAVEGLGNFYGETVLRREEEPRGLLNGEIARSLAPKTMTMLHAGIGLSFAKHTLSRLQKKSSDLEVGSAVEQFLHFCRGSSRAGYTGAAVESLGLVSRFLHGPSMVRRVDCQLRQGEEDCRGYLWHGAGRALYFSPLNFLPGVSSPWRAVAMCRKEAVDDLALSNLLAGFGWAVTLVNMRTPEVMEALLRHHGEFLSSQAGFSNGVMSSLIMRYDTSPEDSSIDPFVSHRPRNAVIAERWRSLVEEPCRTALEGYYPALRETNRLEEVFRFQLLQELLSS